MNIIPMIACFLLGVLTLKVAPWLTFVLGAAAVLVVGGLYAYVGLGHLFEAISGSKAPDRDSMQDRVG